MRLPFLVLGPLLLLACGGSVTVDPFGGDGGGTTWTGGAGGVGGSTGGASCAQTNDGFAFKLGSVDSAQGLDCASAQPGESTAHHMEGMVVKVDTPTGLLVFDQCPPNANCLPDEWFLVVDAPGFTLDVPLGSFIQVDVEIAYPWGCSQAILVRNLPVWGGMPGSGGGEPTLLFEGSDGSANALAGSPFAVTTTALGCGGPDPGCGMPADQYRFDVLGAGMGYTVPVYQGQTMSFEAKDGSTTRPFAFRNLRSHVTGACDDYWNWSFWVTPAPVPK